ncbi:thioredoxin [Komagataeibacter nataicola NRIC 0616]|nr:thioredoxin [Komagataeibacter nataicola NRIC 0616]
MRERPAHACRQTDRIYDHMDYIIGQTPRPDSSGPAGAAPGGGPDPVMDGTQNTFMHDVVDASRDMPVLVDFWATWCNPCKQLTPVLEKVVRAARGRVRLVKIDVDANRALVQQLGQIGLPVQSIPLVAVFWQGQILDMMQGAKPESEVRRFIENALKAAGGGALPAAELIEAARKDMAEGRAEAAAGLFSQVLEIEPENPAAWGGLARALIEMGDDEGAETALNDAPAAIASHAEITGARAALELKREGRKAAEEAEEIRARIAANPKDYAARFELSAALNAAGKRAEAADELLTIMKEDRQWNDDAARLQLIRLFEAWGQTDPDTVAARRRMSSLLFS